MLQQVIFALAVIDVALGGFATGIFAAQGFIGVAGALCGVTIVSGYGVWRLRNE
jgi:hypothetical protein